MATAERMPKDPLLNVKHGKIFFLRWRSEKTMFVLITLCADFVFF